MNSVTKSVSRVNPEVHLVLLLAFFYVFTAINIPAGGGDLEAWSGWAIYIKEHGIRNIYNLHRHPDPNLPRGFLYGPFHMYMEYFFGKWQGSVEQIQRNPHKFRLFILVFDMVGIWFALRFLREKVNRPFYALFLIFNIGILYDTVYWGQVDGAITCLVLIAIYYALRGQFGLSGISFVIGFLIKPQPVIFLPVLVVLWIMSILKKPAKQTILNFLCIALVIFVLLWPFIQAGTLVNYWAMLRDSASVYPIVSVNAGNIWNLFLTEDPNKVSDQVIWYGLSYRQWGLLMASVGFLIVLFPLLRHFYQILRRQQPAYDPALVLLTAGLMPIIFYFFNTQMHERYAHPSVLLLAAYALSTRDFVPYIVVSIANFLVMDRFLRLFDLNRLYDYVTLEQVAILFLFVLIWGVVKLYKKRETVEWEVIPV